MIVELSDHTVGIVSGPVEYGDYVSVELSDENGNIIYKDGIIEDILEDDTTW